MRYTLAKTTRTAPGYKIKSIGVIYGGAHQEEGSKLWPVFMALIINHPKAYLEWGERLSWEYWENDIRVGIEVAHTGLGEYKHLLPPKSNNALTSKSL